MTINYAHRGASGYYPENTMLAFEKAVELGCTGIETDVHMTRDGYLVLMHDEEVNRTTNGTGYIKDYSLRELRQLDAGKWMNKDFACAEVPTLEELLEFTVDKNIFLNLELKTDCIWYKGIEEKLLDEIYKYNVNDKVILSSFNHYSVYKCRQLDKSIKAGLLYMEGLFEPQLYAKTVGVEAIHPYYPAIDNAELVERVRSAGIMINTWTVNDEKEMKKFLEYKVDGIITNYPDRLNTLMEGK